MYAKLRHPHDDADEASKKEENTQNKRIRRRRRRFTNYTGLWKDDKVVLCKDNGDNYETMDVTPRIPWPLGSMP